MSHGLKTKLFPGPGEDFPSLRSFEFIAQLMAFPNERADFSPTPRLMKLHVQNTYFTTPTPSGIGLQF